jgi:hypothetical protein
MQFGLIVEVSSSNMPSAAIPATGISSGISNGSSPAMAWAIAFSRRKTMAKLTTKQREKIPTKGFALKGRRYPIQNEAHAKNALARVSQHGTSAEKAEVRRKVHGKYPGIAVSGMKTAKKSSLRKRAMTKR